MAAKEVIQFPLCVQLIRGATFPVNAFRGSTASPRDLASLFLVPLPARAYRVVLSTAGGLSV
jgi:hypothetical protein